MTNKWEINDQTNDQNLDINDQMIVLVANFWSLIAKHIKILMTKHMNKLMTKYASKLMTFLQAINDQTIYDHIFGRMIRDRKLATNDGQIKIGHLLADFGHFFVTYLSLCTSVCFMA